MRRWIGAGLLGLLVALLLWTPRPAEVPSQVAQNRAEDAGARPERKVEDRRLPPAKPKPYASVAVSGQVRSVAGGPIPDAWVALVPEEGPGESAQGTKTGPEGRYRLQGVGPGRYLLSARAVGFRTKEVWFRKAAVVEDDEGFDFELAPARALHGRVVNDAGQGVGDAVVMALEEHGPRAQPIARTDHEGHFVLEEVDETVLAVAATHREVGAGSGPASDGVEIRLGGRMIQGRVEDASGPVRGAHVEIAVQATGRWILGDPKLRPSVMTDESGRFRLAAADGPVGLRVTAAGHAEQSVTVEGDEAVVVFLPTGLVMGGRVVGPTGEGVHRCTIRIGRQTFSDACGPEGRFRIDTLSPRKRYTIDVRSPGHPPFLMEVDRLSEGMEFRLEEGIRTRVQVRLESGAPLTDFRYVVKRGDQEVDRGRWRSASGLLELPDLAPARHQIVVFDEETRRGDVVEIEPVEGEVLEVGVRLKSFSLK